MSEIHEASMNFDIENVEPFLRRVAQLIDGFGSNEVASVMSDIRRMNVDDEHDWMFAVTYDGRSIPLVLRVFMDDIDAPDLYFFTTSAELASRLQDEMGIFAEEQGK